MTIVVDANIAIAVLDPQHRFHRLALTRCFQVDGIAILNLTRAEALIHPTRVGKFVEASAELDRLGFRTEPLDNETADRARELRATHGNKNFPIVDALVVALGVERGWSVVTCDAKWPAIMEASIEVLT
ncbi:MAG: PIN domain-containing protein [Acidimicrobiales bacterium]